MDLPDNTNKAAKVYFPPSFTKDPRVHRSPKRQIILRLSNRAYDQLRSYSNQAGYTHSQARHARGLAQFIYDIWHYPEQQWYDTRSDHSEEGQFLVEVSERRLRAAGLSIERRPLILGSGEPMSAYDQIRMGGLMPAWLPEPDPDDSDGIRRNRTFGPPLADDAAIKPIYEMGLRLGIAGFHHRYSATDHILLIVGATLEAWGLGFLTAQYLTARPPKPAKRPRQPFREVVNW